MSWRLEAFAAALYLWLALLLALHPPPVPFALTCAAGCP